MPALYLAYHLATFAVFILFVTRYFSIIGILAVMGIATVIATVYNTVWYHRYCSHRAFKFRNRWWPRLFLWSNPVCFREESYVIPHRLHHSHSDEVGDPYGPHLGWLGSYLATESQQKLNRNLSRTDYDRLAKSLEHIGFVKKQLRTVSTKRVRGISLALCRPLYLCQSALDLVGLCRGGMAGRAGVDLRGFLLHISGAGF
ncbi:MAG: Fatty acid desaturase [Pedosphaera sp.]|nr:Fatty acid desaturase [Pedosphaera sp.]